MLNLYFVDGCVTACYRRTLNFSFILEERRKRKRQRLQTGSQNPEIMFVLSGKKDRRKKLFFNTLSLSVNEPEVGTLKLRLQFSFAVNRLYGIQCKRSHDVHIL